MLIKRLGDYLAWLGGADQAALEQVPSARARFAQMAGILLTTAGLAVVSMSFALHDGLKVPWPPTVFLGLLWGFVILNIDRFLVLSMGSTRHRGRLLLMAAPRFAMAVVLALVISTPLVLRVFASDINAQLYTMQLERSKHQAALEASSKERREANHLQQQITADVAVLDGHLPESVTSPELQAAQAKVTTLQGQEATAQHAMNVAYEAWVCELYGHQCYGASGVPGNGNLAQIKQHEYEQATGAVNSIKRQLEGAISAENAAQNNVGVAKSADLAQAQQRARAALPGLRRQYNVLAAFLRNESATGTRLNSKDTGILAQIQALSNLDGQDPALLFAHLAVAALFFLIEILPVGVKILLNLAPMTAYEIVASSKEDEIIDRARARRIEVRRIEEGKSRTRINVENDMREREESLGKRANEHVASEMTTILDIALREWSSQVRARLSSAGHNQSSNGASPPNNVRVSPATNLPSSGNL